MSGLYPELNNFVTVSLVDMAVDENDIEVF